MRTTLGSINSLWTLVRPRSLAAMIAVAVAGVGTPAVAQLGTAPSVPAGQLQDATPLRTYIVQLADKPGISYDGSVAGFQATAPAAGARYNRSAAHVRAYTDHLLAEHQQALSAIGATSRKVYDYTHAMNGFAARLTASEAAALRTHPDVVNVWEDYAMKLQTNNSPEFLGLLDRRDGLRRSLHLYGEDVIVGVIDTGIVQEHPSFSDTRTYPLPGFCEEPRFPIIQTICDFLAEHNTRVVYDDPPADWNGICQEGEAWSASDCNNKLIGARWFADGFLAVNGTVLDAEFLSARDSDGHGSHTAGTAAGNEVTATLEGTPLATISGMAPRARVAAYKACWAAANDDGCFFSDTAAATDAAVGDGVDVINFSIGTAYSFTDPQDLAFLDAAAAGVFIARSAGNEGPGVSTSAAGEPWVMTVGASTQDGTAFAKAVTINSPASVAGDYAALEGAITKPLVLSGAITDDVIPADPIDACTPLNNAIGGHVVLIARGVCNFSVKIENAVAAGASAVLMFSDDRPKTVMGGTATAITLSIPGVMIDNEPGLAILAELTAGNVVNTTMAPGVFITEPLTGNIMADFSSRGPYPNEPDWIKPDITAPGVRILAPYTPNKNDGSLGDMFAYLQGTSMSSPHIAGLGALIREAHPTWTPAQVKSALMTTARQDVVKEDGVTPADPFDFGAGHVDPNKAVDPGLTYDADLIDYLAASCGTESPLLTASDCDFVETTLGLSTDPADLNLPSIGIGTLLGTKTIHRTVTAVNDFRGNSHRRSVYHAVVEAPAGFDVTVTPSTLSLRAGDTASFEVTITNVSAPPGQWFFGSLTWQDNRGHAVRSPIAVNAKALDAPAQIDGAGAAGTQSFDITFGYTGAYAAGVHGLNLPSLTLVTIPDDPNNSYQFLGAGVEIAYLAEIPAGTAFTRWSTFNEYTSGNDDIDLYLYYCPNFSCTLIGSSANGDSNEEVQVFLPVNDPAITDPYLILAHGYETDGGLPADVILFDWNVGFVDDAGNMTVTAPTSASIGVTAPVTVDWSGLAAGPAAKYVGGVSHSDASGFQGATVVDITNDQGFGFCDLVPCAP